MKALKSTENFSHCAQVPKLVILCHFALECLKCLIA